MSKPFEEMSNSELRHYLSQHRNDEDAFSQALEVLMSRKKNHFKYPDPLSMPYEEVQAIFLNKIQQLSE